MENQIKTNKSVLVKLFPLAVVITLLLTSACKKENLNNPGANGAVDGSITFKGQTSTFTNSSSSDTVINNKTFVSLITSIAGNLNPKPQLQILLYPAPLTSGVYTLMNGAAWAYNDTLNSANAKQILIAYSTANSLYLSTGGNTNQTVLVTVNNGNVSISGLVPMTGGAINSLTQDSSALNLSINAALPGTSSAPTTTK